MDDFPQQQLSEFLAGWYDDQLRSTLRIPKSPEELLKHGGNVFDIQPELSSTCAVPILLRLKDLLGFEPTKSVIKRGGYRSKDEFVRDMVASVEKAFIARRTPVATSAAEGKTAHGGL